MISADQFQFLKCIGKNANGPTSLQRNKKNNTNVVVKIIPTFFIEKQISSIVAQFSKIYHPALTAVHGIIEPEQESPTNYKFVSDFYENGSLAEIYKRFPFSNESQFWSPTRKSIIAFGIAAAMQYLHYKDITHQFLTPYNVLFDKFYQPHVTDYWTSSFLPKGSQQNSSFGFNSIYSAPECLKISNLSNKVDIYSYGMILYELAFEKPLNTSDQVNLTDILRDLTLKSYKNSSISNRLYNLIINCIQLDPLKRPSFDLIIASFYDSEPLFLNTDICFLSQYRLSVIKTIIHEMSKVSLFEFGNDPMNKRNQESMLQFVQSSQYNIKPLFKYGQLTKSVNTIKFAADKGNKSAQFFYSLIIEKENNEESMKYLKKAADQNYMRAVEKLMILDENNEEYLKKAADLGSARARIKYALKTQKLYYLRMAAKSHDSEALYLLATREENGPTIKFLDIPDYKNMLASYEKQNPSDPQKAPPKPSEYYSAIDFDNDDTGYPFNQVFFQDQEKAYNVISSISEKVIYKDLNSAINHYNQAVALNNSDAINRLDEIGKNGQKMVSKYQIIFTQNDQKKIDELIMYSIMLLRGSFNVEKNASQAIQILKYAAKHSSNPDAQFALFKIMKNDYLKLNSFSTIENLDSAIGNFKCEENSNDNENPINNFDFNNTNYPNLKNDIEALMYLKSAAEQGHIRASLYYAHHLITKNSVQVKPTLLSSALRFYRQAANMGNIKAILTYSNLIQSYSNPNFNNNLIMNYNIAKYSNLESIVYCRIAADRGSPHAQITYGKYLENKRIHIDHQNIKRKLFDKNKIGIEGENEEEEEEGVDENENENEEEEDIGDNNNFMNSFLQVRQKNLDKALFYYKLAAKQGMTDAMLAIAQLYEKEKNLPFCHMKITERDITKKYLVAGSCGDPFAMYNVGQRYAQGIGVPQDINQALVYFRIASFMGNITAQYKYGHYLAFSQKAKQSQAIKDANEGLNFLILAVSQGYYMGFLLSLYNEFDSMNMADQSSVGNVVNLFRLGGNKPDNTFMNKIRSIENNNNADSNANDNDNEIKNSNQMNIPDFKANYRIKDWVDTYSTYLLASQSIGLLFRNGLLDNNKPNLSEAMFWLEDSTNLGSIDTFLYIGEIFESWKEYKKAFSTYQLGHQEGVLNCTLKLARCFEKGIGCQKDIEAAAELYESVGVDNLSYYLNAAKLYDRMYQQLSQDAKKSRMKQRAELKYSVMRLVNGIQHNTNEKFNYYETYSLLNSDFNENDYKYNNDSDDEQIQFREKEILKRIYSLYSKAVVLDDPICTAHYRMGQILLSDTLTKINSKNNENSNDSTNSNQNELDDINDDFPSFLLSSFNKKEFGITFLQEAVNNNNTDAMIEMASFIKSGGRINLRKHRTNNNNNEETPAEVPEDDNIDIFFCGNRINHSIIYINYYSDEQKFEFMHNLIIKASRRGNIRANVIYASALINSYKNHINDRLWMKMVGKGFKILKKIIDSYHFSNLKKNNPHDEFYSNYLMSFYDYAHKNENDDENASNNSTKSSTSIDDERNNSLDDAVSDAYVLLAKLYENGDVVLKNKSRAISFYLSASHLGNQAVIMKEGKITQSDEQSLKDGSCISDDEDESILNDEILINLKKYIDEMLQDLNKDLFMTNMQKIEKIAICNNCWQAQFVLGKFYNGNEYIEREVEKSLFFFRMAANNIIYNQIKTDLIFKRADVFVDLSNILIEKNNIESALYYLDKAVEMENKEAIRKKINLILSNYSAKGISNNEISSCGLSSFTPSIEDIDHFYSSMRNRFVCKSKKALPTARINDLNDLSSSLGFLKNDDDSDNNENDLTLIKQKDFLFGRDIFLSSFGYSKPCIDVISNLYTFHDMIKSFHARHNIAYILSKGLTSSHNTNIPLEYLREAAVAESIQKSSSSSTNPTSSSASNSRHLFYKYNYETPDDYSYYMNINEKNQYDTGGYSQYHYAKFLLNIAERPNCSKILLDEQPLDDTTNKNTNNDNDNDNEIGIDVTARFVADHYLEQAASKGNIEAIRLLSSLKIDSNPTMSSHYGKLGSDLGDRLSMTRRACDLIFGSVLIGYRVTYNKEDDIKVKKNTNKSTEEANENENNNEKKENSSHEVPISFVGKPFMRESRSLLEVVARTSGRAAFVLGALYESGELLKKNYKKAFEYYSASASLGFKEALLRISAILAFGGFGLERDEKRSFEYAKKAVYFRVPSALKAKEEGKLDKLDDKFVDFIAGVMEKSIPLVVPKDKESNEMKVVIENNQDSDKKEKQDQIQPQNNEDDKKGFKLRRNERCLAMSELFRDCFGLNGIIYGICEDDCEYDHEYEYEYDYDDYE